jgi:hypothetical protein
MKSVELDQSVSCNFVNSSGKAGQTWPDERYDTRLCVVLVAEGSFEPSDDGP